MRLGKYEVGKILGEGHFGKVKFAKNIETGQSFAVKILEKKKILNLKINDQVFLLIILFVLILLLFSGIYLHYGSDCGKFSYETVL